MSDRIMLDIETLGTEPGCAIVAIGACRFDTRHVGQTFEASVDLQSNGEAGLTVDHETLSWWLTQDEQAREQLTGGESLSDALDRLAGFVDGDVEIWANSPTFDCEILAAGYEAVGMDLPWHYWQLRDFRTLQELDIDEPTDHEGVEHDAVDDAVYQATVAASVLGKIEEVEA